MSQAANPPSSPNSADRVTFSFGRNWDAFVRTALSPERIDISRRCLLDYLKLPDLNGKYFLDIGSGSGLSSLAAHDAGAARVVSFDVDPASVATTRRVRQMRGDPARWEVRAGSILDPEFIQTVEPADIVYSWGVLHHTGRMYDAIRNAAGLVRPGGLLAIALYTTVASADYWLNVKRRYNARGAIGKRLMEANFVLRDLVVSAIRQRTNPWKRVREYKRTRGMSYLHDVKDWLGGYPYEHAKVEEIVFFCRDEFGCVLENLRTGEGCTEYLFQRPAASLQLPLTTSPAASPAPGALRKAG